jgi:uncharacterized protein
MANRLINEISPYLLQHAENPVEWYPWAQEALEKARQEQKPIFLSIGYAACHWCHVMAHESFEDPITAALMNELFINIKVDREERPDLDSIYMDAVVALTGQGGWPMSVFLTPEGEPFFGGTYFPPVRRYNMPAFREVLTHIHQLWQTDRSQLVEHARDLVKSLQPPDTQGIPSARISPELLDQASITLARQYDWHNGGWGQAPKFPQPMAIEFLLRRAVQGDKMARDVAEHALKSMVKGGMYDVVGGGFSRYSTDNDWLVPHFEKMLYDNAQLALAYLHAYLVTDQPDYRRVCEETLDFVLSELSHPAGGFFSSLDADSEGEEGKFYLWKEEDIDSAISPPLVANLWKDAYGLKPGGNFEGHTIFQRQMSDEALAEKYSLADEQVSAYLIEARSQLTEFRSTRIRPATDDKVLTGWNGLMLIAFAEAGRSLNNDKYLDAAVKNANFLLTELRPEGALQRAWRAGRAQHPAFLEDYASLILGLTALYQADFNPRWYQAAQELAAEMKAKFADPGGGFFDTPQNHENLVIRPKSLQDNAIPSGNSLAILALLQLSAFSGETEDISLVEDMWKLAAHAVTRYPTAFAFWLTAMDYYLAPSQEVAILSPDLDDVIHWTRAVYQQFIPHTIFAASTLPPPTGSPALLDNRPLLDNKTTAYVCRGFVCQQPTNDLSNFLKQLGVSLP